MARFGAAVVVRANERERFDHLPTGVSFRTVLIVIALAKERLSSLFQISDRINIFDQWLGKGLLSITRSRVATQGAISAQEARSWNGYWSKSMNKLLLTRFPSFTAYDAPSAVVLGALTRPFRNARRT